MLLKEKEVLQRYSEEVYKEFLQAEQAAPTLLSEAKAKLEKTFKVVVEKIEGACPIICVNTQNRLLFKLEKRAKL